MDLYQRKPVPPEVVRAYQYQPHRPLPDWLGRDTADGISYPSGIPYLFIPNLGRVSQGEWVILTRDRITGFPKFGSMTDLVFRQTFEVKSPETPDPGIVGPEEFDRQREDASPGKARHAADRAELDKRIRAYTSADRNRPAPPPEDDDMGQERRDNDRISAHDNRLDAPSGDRFTDATGYGPEFDRGSDS